MRLKARATQPVEVEVWPDGQKEILTLHVNCLSPVKFFAMEQALKACSDDVEGTMRVVSGLVNNWENVTDENGSQVAFTPERLTELQGEYFGLTEAICLAIGEQVPAQRKKLLGLSDESTAEVAQPAPTQLAAKPTVSS